MRLRVYDKLMHIIGEAYHTENIIPGYLSGSKKRPHHHRKVLWGDFVSPIRE